MVSSERAGGDPPWSRGLNHNVPLVGGEGSEPPQLGELLAFSGTSVAAAQPKYRKDARARRTLAIDGDKLVDTATARLSRSITARSCCA